LSRVVVNEIEAKAGNDIKFNSNIANPTTVQDQGTATTNLQQGLVKVWVNYDAVDQATKGSLNQSSLTDHAAGEFTTTHSNNFNSAEDKCVSTCEFNTENEGSSESSGNLRGGTHSSQNGGTAQATSSLRWDTYQGSTSSGDGSHKDFDGCYCMIIGALA